MATDLSSEHGIDIMTYFGYSECCNNFTVNNIVNTLGMFNVATDLQYLSKNTGYILYTSNGKKRAQGPGALKNPMGKSYWLRGETNSTNNIKVGYNENEKVIH